MSKKKYQIFISSTYEDLKEERNAVLKAILKMQYFPIGMEMFNAGSTEHWKIITETIDSSDYYVLILGNRYGSVLEDGDEKGISYTEREYRYAIKRGVPVIAFIIDKNADVKAGNVETDPGKKKKLEQFKKDVKKRIVGSFKNPYDLQYQVATALRDEIDHVKRPGWVRSDTADSRETVENGEKTIRFGTYPQNFMNRKEPIEWIVQKD